MSLTEDDLRTLDQYAHDQQLPSRSAAVQRAIALLRAPALEQAYAAAWDEWDSSPDAASWDATAGDGLREDTADGAAGGDAPR